MTDFRTKTVDQIKMSERSKANYERAMNELYRLSQIALREQKIKKENNVRNRNSKNGGRSGSRCDDERGDGA